MSILKKASKETTKLFLGDDEEDYVEVLTDISKRQFNAIVKTMPGKIGDDVSQDFTIPQALDFQRLLFDTFVVGWSLDDHATLDAYDDLTHEAGTAIDQALAAHFGKIGPSKQESK